jgi:4-hydroxy-tetrahydrodipicolinate reductase
MSALRYILRNPALELVGLRCFTDAKAGRDAGEIAGLDPVGVTATRDAAELVGLGADCVLYMPADPEFGDITTPGTRAHELFLALVPILESGTNVVSILTSQVGPQFLGPAGRELVDRLSAACTAGGSTFFGTGFEPGFMADVLPLCLASSCAEVRSIKAYEILDYSDYDALESLQSVGLCVRPEQLAGQSPDALLNIWGSVPRYVARGIGATLDDVRLTVDFRVAPETFTTHRGIVVEQGMLAALRFAVEGVVEGEPVISVEHVNRMRDDLAPEWPTLEPGGGYRIEIEGSNPVHADFHLSLPGGSGHSFGDAMAATAARAVNSVEAVCRASPGVKTFFDLPMVTGVHSFRPPSAWR